MGADDQGLIVFYNSAGAEAAHALHLLQAHTHEVASRW